MSSPPGEQSEQNENDVTTPASAGTPIRINTTIRTQGKSAFIICDSSSSEEEEEEEEGAHGDAHTPERHTPSVAKQSSREKVETSKSSVTVVGHCGALSPAARLNSLEDTPPLAPRRGARTTVISLSDEEEEDDCEEEEEEEEDGSYLAANTSQGGWDDPDDNSFDSTGNTGVLEYFPTPKLHSTEALASTKKTATATPQRSPRAALQPLPSALSTPLLCKEVKVPDTASRAAATAFKKDRENMTKRYFESFNEVAFKGRLPANVQVLWNKRLLTTAGITKLKFTSSRRGSGASSSTESKQEKHARLAAQRTAVIELSEKVCDSEDRLKTTLLHEMCHAATWLLDSERKPPHGPSFWKYAKLASNALPELGEVTTCHSFVVHKPFRFKCTNVECGLEYGRHSKSIDVERHRCGLCSSELVYEGKFSADGTKTSHAASGFSLFVKEHFAAVKSMRLHGRQKSHAEVMLELSVMYHSQRSQPQAQPQTQAASHVGSYAESGESPQFALQTETLESTRMTGSPASEPVSMHAPLMFDLTQDTPPPQLRSSKLDTAHVELGEKEEEEEDKEEEEEYISLMDRLALGR